MAEFVSKRLCRVALLPDCHVQSGRCTWPTQPTRRLYGAARNLLESCLNRLEQMNVDAALLLGDTLDPADSRGLDWLSSLIRTCPFAVYTIIGNHESYGSLSISEFYRRLEIPASGNYVVRVNEVPFVMLATPDQDGFSNGSSEFAWLRETLEQLSDVTNVFCCAHLSLVLHPGVQGARNDGMQVLWSAAPLLDLLHEFPNVRGWIAGHKNIPSKVEERGVLHLLSPQLIQAPCAFRVLDIFSNGIESKLYEIEEKELAELSRQAYGTEYVERLGRPEDRDFSWFW